jgi:transcription termination factor Rho
MLLPELQSLAASLGISGTARMRKGELITAISERQGGGTAPAPAATTTTTGRSTRSRSNGTATAVAAPVTAQAAPVAAPPATEAAPPAPAAAPSEAPAAVQVPAQTSAAQTSAAQTSTAQTSTPQASEAPAAQAPESKAQAPADTQADARTETGERTDRGERAERGRDRQRNQRGEGDRQRGEGNDRQRGESSDRQRGEGNEREPRGDREQRGDRDSRGDREPRADRNDRDRNDRDRGDRDRGGRNDAQHDDDDGEGGEGGRRSRRSRFRDRRRGRDRDTADGQRDGGRDGGREGGRDGGRDGGREPNVTEDDVLVPVAGILDVLDNYAFVRTTGYLSGANDVYVSMSQVKKHGLRRGDAVTGAVRAAPREGGSGDQRRDKYNPLVRLDTINGMEPEEARRRPEFYKLTPLYPQERLRLETEPHILTTRVIDLVMPLGKGQRALIVSPPKAGKTMVLQALANAITHNNPECHLMVVLVDERPEEVTDMQRSVKGEVIAATFDRPPQDHTTVAELAIERAKRLVELGHDVVVLLDSVTRLGRSYNLAAPASGRIMSGGIDSTALYPPKRFLGAARNIENGGSLTILATALVETGSMMDTVIFEEFKGTGNAELKLDRKIADKRTFPAVDVSASGTRKEEILLGKEELAIVHKLRKVLSSLESSAALDLLLDRLKQSRTNIEFLMQIAKSTPGE